jgi:Fe2+ or Zn2+ uptake regulation protein
MRVTTQRLVIHRVLHELGTHTTAEAMQAAIADRLPGVSLPTVYATLDLLDDLGAVRRVAVPGGPALYDPRIDPHHHLVCRRCGGAQDIDAPIELEPVLAAAAEQGFSARHAEVVVAGVCAACAA